MDGENNIYPAEILAGMKRKRGWNNSNGEGDSNNSNGEGDSNNSNDFLDELQRQEAEVRNDEGDSSPAAASPPPPPGPGRAALANLSEGQWNKLTDVWCRLIHIDVEKDHGTNYNTHTVNSFLPYDKYKTNFFGTPENDASGQLISRDFHGVMDKDGIFNAVVDTTIETINKINCNDEERTITIRITNEQYNYKCFDISGAENQARSDILASTIQQFIGPHTFSAFIDTSNKTEKLIGALPPNVLNIVYAYTSAVENDAAGKMNKTSVKGGGFEVANYDEFLRKFYLEKEPTQFNKTSITYPPFGEITRNNGLSHVMCKYPIILELHNGTNYKDGKLRVILKYIRNNGNDTVIVEEGENTATKRRNSIQSLSAQKISPLKLEKIFISKYHGDIGQVLEMYRDIELVNTDNSGVIKKEENTKDMKACFVSIDLNAILKAFTEGIGLVFYYINASNKLIVFKNNNLNSHDIILANMKYQAKSLYDSVSQEIRVYNEKVSNINESRKKFYDKINNLLEKKPEGENSKDKYKKAIELGIQIATLITFIPSKDISKIAEPRKNTNDNIEALKGEIAELNNKRKEMAIPSEYMKLKVMDNDNLAKTHIENELIFTRVGGKSGNFLSSVQFHNLPGLPNSNTGKNTESLSHRIASKLQSSLAIDIIKYVYNKLSNYDLHKKFIDHLQLALDEKYIQDYFKTVLKISGMEGSPSTGGTRYLDETRMKKRNKNNKTTKIKHLQRGGDTNLEILILKEELEDIKKLINYYKEDYSDEDILNKTNNLLFEIHRLEIVGQGGPATQSLTTGVFIKGENDTQPQTQATTHEEEQEEQEEEYFQDGVRFVSTFPYIRILYELLTSYGESADESVKGGIYRLIESLLKLSQGEVEITTPSTPRRLTSGEGVHDSGASSESGSTRSGTAGKVTPPAESRSVSPRPGIPFISPERPPTRRGGAKSLKKSKKQQKQRKSKYQSRTAKHKR